ncbi:MAG TPA: hypothetical protein DDY93_01710, partial [Dehalococcoidia bacterium]|nr:hypothetical protein [Dehalococcoidia bacterium]
VLGHHQFLVDFLLGDFDVGASGHIGHFGNRGFGSLSGAWRNRGADSQRDCHGLDGDGSDLGGE